MSESTIQVSIEGMTCSSCVYKIECEVGDLEGVSDAKVDLNEKKGNFTFDSGRVGSQDIVNKINSLGFKANLVNRFNIFY